MTKQREVEKFKDHLTKFFRSTGRPYWTHLEVARKVERLWKLYEAEKIAEKVGDEKS